MRQKVSWLSTHYHYDSVAYHLEEDAAENNITAAWVCINHLVQGNRLIFSQSVILHIFMMFTLLLNMH